MVQNDKGAQPVDSPPGHLESTLKIKKFPIFLKIHCILSTTSIQRSNLSNFGEEAIEIDIIGRNVMNIFSLSLYKLK